MGLIDQLAAILAYHAGCPCDYGGLDDFMAETHSEEWFEANCKTDGTSERCWKEVLNQLMKKRIDKDTYYLKIAETVAMRSTCLHRQYGAVIVSNDKIIATGYNGAPRGEPNCCDSGRCYCESHSVPAGASGIHGSQYGSCVAVHAEQNAIICASRNDMQGATLYLACLDDTIDPVPCNICDRMIKNAGIAKVVNRKGPVGPV